MASPARWSVIRHRDTLDVHIIPVNDTRPHDEYRQCWCRPCLKRTALRTLVVHNSADGREYFEPDHDEDDAVESVH